MSDVTPGEGPTGLKFTHDGWESSHLLKFQEAELPAVTVDGTITVETLCGLTGPVNPDLIGPLHGGKSCENCLRINARTPA